MPHCEWCLKELDYPELYRCEDCIDKTDDCCEECTEMLYDSSTDATKCRKHMTLQEMDDLGIDIDLYCPICGDLRSENVEGNCDLDAIDKDMEKDN